MIIKTTYRWIKYKINSLFKLYQWYKNVFIYEFDCDCRSIFLFIKYKLERTRAAMLNSCVVYDHKEIKALNLAIKLSNKIFLNLYEDKLFDKHEQKWGKLETWTTPIEDGEYFQFFSQRPGAIFEKDKLKERKETLLIPDIAKAQRSRDEKILYDILKKYLYRWWV